MRRIPKIIENLREMLLQEARKQLFENGYQELNIRTVAAKCGIAVGTFYNYFSSKEVLAASIILEDWMRSLNEMKQRVNQENELFSGLGAVYGELLRFEELYHDIFQSSAAVYGKYISRERHIKLRGQLEEPIKQMCVKTNQMMDAFTLTFLAENFLSASQERIEFEKLEGILRKLLN